MAKYADVYKVFVNAPEGVYSYIMDFVRRWFDSETDKLFPVPACEFSFDGNNTFTVYASGYYFGKMGLVKIYQTTLDRFKGV